MSVDPVSPEVYLLVEDPLPDESALPLAISSVI